MNTPAQPDAFWTTKGPPESQTLVAMAGGMSLLGIAPWATGAHALAVFGLGLGLGLTGAIWALTVHRPATVWAQQALKLGLRWSRKGRAEWLQGIYAGRNVQVRVWANKVDVTCAPFRSLERDFPATSDALTQHLIAVRRGAPPVTGLEDPITRAAFQAALDQGLEVRALGDHIDLRSKADPEQLATLLERVVNLCMTLDQSRLRRKSDTLF
ncbi:MAG: hypothetical protein ACI9VR_001131 [Cognaticolwellia sp.]|jgi:hypothetical protein